MYSLGDEEEEAGGAEDAHGCGAWAAELGLLVLRAGVLLPRQDQPPWLSQLLYGVEASRSPSAQQQEQQAPEGRHDSRIDNVQALMRSPLSAALAPLVAAAGEQQPLLAHLLAPADWRRLAAGIHAEEGTAGAPWLLPPLLMVPGALMGQDATAVGGRLVQSAAQLSRAAVLAGSPQAAQCAAGAAGGLLLLSVCQGSKHVPERQAQHATSAAAQQPVEQHEQVQIPEDFPLELLADTVEGQQLALLQQERQLRQELAVQQAAGGDDGAAARSDAQQEAAAAGSHMPLVEVQACWSLSCDQHVALLQQALLPLAASQSSLALGASLQPEHCLPQLVAGAQLGGDAAVTEWHAPRLAELLDAAAAAAAVPQQGAADQQGSDAAAVAGLAAVLLPLVRPAVTLLTSEPLPFSNSELPLDTEAALYLSMAPDAGGGAGRQQRPLRSLHQTLTALLPGAEARRRAQQRAEQALHGSLDSHVIQTQLSLAVQVRVLGCLAGWMHVRSTLAASQTFDCAFGAPLLRRPRASSWMARRWRPACCACCTRAPRCTPRPRRSSCPRACCASWQRPKTMAGRWAAVPPPQRRCSRAPTLRRPRKCLWWRLVNLRPTLRLAELRPVAMSSQRPACSWPPLLARAFHLTHSWGWRTGPLRCTRPLLPPWP